MSRRSARAATSARSSRGEAPEALSVLTLDLLLAVDQDLALRDQHQVEPGKGLLAPEALPQETLGAVAGDRPSDLPRGGEAETAVRPAVGGSHHEEQWPVEPDPLPESLSEIRPADEPLGGAEPRPAGSLIRGQAPIRLRPFWRRRLSTRRPPLLRIRTRKPCVLLRLRLLGWKVRFMADRPGPKGPGPRWACLPWAKPQVYTTLLFPVNAGPAFGRLGALCRPVPCGKLGRFGERIRRPFQALETSAFPQVLKSLCKKGFVGR